MLSGNPPSNIHQIESTDRKPDQLVYQLYDLTDAEINIVEEATTSSTR
jgi:hypothetical protein